MKITEQNISYIAHLLKKTISNGFVEQTFYPSSKKFNSVLKHFNVEDNWRDFLYKVEESNKSHFIKGIVEIDNFFNEYKYIRIHNNGERNSSFFDMDFDDGYMAMVIHCGNEISFNKNRIVIKQKHPLGEEKVFSIINY